MTKKNEDWNPLCCYNTLGACGGCTGSVAAYVVKWYNDDDVDELIKSTYIRLCPTFFDEEDDTSLGLTLFHEIIHMISGVGDVDGAYEKYSAVVLAENYPEDARLNANNYMLYSAQNGLSLLDYDTFTDSWGKHTHSSTCTDNFSNCLAIASVCCAYKTASNGLKFRENCCASCKSVEDIDPEC